MTSGPAVPVAGGGRLERIDARHCWRRVELVHFEQGSLASRNEHGAIVCKHTWFGGADGTSIARLGRQQQCRKQLQVGNTPHLDV